MSKKLLLAGVAAVALSAAWMPAYADNIVQNQWYAGDFTGTPSPLFAPGTNGTNGPTVGGGKANAVGAPALAGVLNATITMGSAGYLTVTDVETSGDRFAMDINGVGAVSTGAGNPDLNPAGNIAVGSLTSAPCNFCTSGAGENISAALGSALYSSGTFYLPTGVDTITGEFLGVVGFGDMDFIVTPEPSTLTLFGAALLGLGGLRRWRNKKAA